MTVKLQDQLAPVAAHSIYPIETFKRITGLGKAAIRSMRKTGFIVRRIGKRSYVWGKDFQDWIENQAEIVGAVGSTSAA